MGKIFTFMAGQNSRSALNTWAARQHRPAEDKKVLVLHPVSNSRSFSS
jgi:hypothetical protein